MSHNVWITVGIAVASVATAGCTVAVRSSEGQGSDVVYVCHGNRNPRWLRVSASAADAHRGHGDRVSEEPQEEGGACERSDIDSVGAVGRFGR
jgi:hypothetical protein